MNRESHHDIPPSTEFTGATIFDANLGIQAEKERLKHSAYEKAREILQGQNDKYNATFTKIRSPHDAFQGPTSPQAPTQEMVNAFIVLEDIKRGQSNDADVRKVLIGEREKAKEMIKAEETRLARELDDRFHFRGPSITPKGMIEASEEWKNSPANQALTAEIEQINQMLTSLEAAN